MKHPGKSAGFTADVLEGLVVETDADSQSAAGMYPIVASGAEALNYVLNYESGMLSVYAADSEPELPIDDQHQSQADHALYEAPSHERGTAARPHSIVIQLTDEGLVEETDKQTPTDKGTWISRAKVRQHRAPPIVAVLQ